MNDSCFERLTAHLGLPDCEGMSSRENVNALLSGLERLSSAGVADVFTDEELLDGTAFGTVNGTLSYIFEMLSLAIAQERCEYVLRRAHQGRVN